MYIDVLYHAKRVFYFDKCNRENPIQLIIYICLPLLKKRNLVIIWVITFKRAKKVSFSILYNTFLCKYYQTKYFFFLYSFPKRWYNLGFGKSNFLQANLTIISLQSLTFRWYTGQTLKWEYLVICLPLDNIHYRDQRFSISWLITFFTDNAYNLFCF